MNRPKKADFQNRIGHWFDALLQGQAPGIRWKLTSVESLDPPDEDGLRELECFIVSFHHDEKQILPQGTYHLSSDEGFETTLFAIPYRDDTMVVTIN